MLAPVQVRLVSVEELPQLDVSRSAVLFPDDEAVAAEDVDVASISNVIVVDSKWGQARGVVASDKLRGMRHVRLRSYLTSYWRRVLPRRLPWSVVASLSAPSLAAGTTPPGFRPTGYAPWRLCSSCAERCGCTARAARVAVRLTVLCAVPCPQLHAKVHSDCHCFDNLLWCAFWPRRDVPRRDLRSGCSFVCG